MTSPTRPPEEPLSADSDPPLRPGMRTRTVVTAGLSLVAVLLVAMLVALNWPDPDPQVPSLAGRAFAGGEIRTSSVTAAYSPDGGRIAVLTDEGVGLASNGQVRRFTRPGARIVAFTWMPDSRRLLVLEGPVATGFLAAVDLTGKVVGSVELDPAFPPGSGFGLAVDDATRRAASVTVERDALGGTGGRDLVTVDLQSGVTRVMGNAEALESNPQFVDDDHVVLTERRAGTAQVVLVELASGRRTRLTPAGQDATLVGTLAGGDRIAYTTVGRSGRVRLWATGVVGGEPRLLDTFAPGQVVVAVEPSARRALVSVPATGALDGDPGGERVLRDVVLAGTARR